MVRYARVYAETDAFLSAPSYLLCRAWWDSPDDPNIRLRGISGSVKDVKRADKVVIQFGHFRQENEDLISFDLTRISHSTGTEVSGLLGFTMLRMLTMKIDYRDGLVDFDYKPNPWRR